MSKDKYITTLDNMKNDFTKQLIVNFQGQIVLPCHKNVKNVNEINEEYIKEQLKNMYGIKLVNIVRITLKDGEVEWQNTK